MSLQSRELKGGQTLFSQGMRYYPVFGVCPNAAVLQQANR
jgi:hypothetical protein